MALLVNHSCLVDECSYSLDDKPVVPRSIELQDTIARLTIELNNLKRREEVQLIQAAPKELIKSTHYGRRIVIVNHRNSNDEWED